MTLTSAWVRGWLDRPDDAVLVDAATGTTLTGSMLEAATRAAAARLAAAGVTAGDRVLLSCPPSVATVLAYVAILRLGAVVVPANTAYTSAELDHIVGDVRPTLGVVDDPARVPGLRATTVDLAALPEGADVVLDASGDDDLAMVGYTSGTTGRPKGAMLSHGNLLAGARALVEAWGWTRADRLVHALPMFHMHGLGAGLNGSFTAGASVVVVPKFEPEAVVAAAHDHAATMFFGVPTMYTKLAEAGALQALSGLRLLVSGSAPLDPVLFERVAAEAGQAPVERYGMTETMMLCSNTLERRVPGAVGVPLPGVELRLADEGGVEVRGPNVFRGYWERPDADAEAFTPDGWFRTGDVGELDDDGWLRLVGRKSDLIISGGYNVYPREVEDAILAHPSVLDAAVVGLPDATWGETVCAFVVPRAGEPLDVDAVAEAAAASLARFKQPRRWEVVDELPRNAMGKVRRDVLRSLATS